MSIDSLLLLDVSGWIAADVLGSHGGAVNAEGVHTEGPGKFFTRLFELLIKQRPSYLVVACDSARETLERKQWFPEYKSKRPEKEPNITAQYQLIYKALKELEFPLCRVDRWEADDVVASYAHQFSEVMDSTVIVSEDKDLHQLLDLKNTTIFKRNGTTFLREHVEKHWGVPVEKIRHVQALAGDSSDGIPGARGIGVKKAVPLVLKYGTAKKAKAAADDLTSGTKIALKAFDAELNLKLVTLNRSLPIPEELPAWTQPTSTHARKVLHRFGLSVVI
jgi:DNA polymerase-1